MTHLSFDTARLASLRAPLASLALALVAVACGPGDRADSTAESGGEATADAVAGPPPVSKTGPSDVAGAGDDSPTGTAPGSASGGAQSTGSQDVVTFGSNGPKAENALPSIEELEAAMLVVPAELAVVPDESLRLETDPKDFPMPRTVGGVPVRIEREFHPSSGVLMRIKSIREDSVGSERGAVLHGPEWAYFNTAALSSIKWWKDNVAHGPVQHWRRVGTRKSEGRFVNGERDGLQRTFSKNGTLIKQGVFAAGRRLGAHEEWFASGQRMKSEAYVEDQLEGVRRVWDREGLLMQLENYVGGKRHGRWSDFHPKDGAPREWGEFDHGVRTGVWERASKTGVILESSHFKADRRDGLTKKWNEAGQLIEEVTYVAGARTGPRRTWYDDGTLQSEGALEDGLRTGYWKYQKANGEVNELWSGEYAEDQRVGPGDPPK